MWLGRRIGTAERCLSTRPIVGAALLRRSFVLGWGGSKLPRDVHRARSDDDVAEANEGVSTVCMNMCASTVAAIVHAAPGDTPLVRAWSTRLWSPEHSAPGTPAAVRLLSALEGSAARPARSRRSTLDRFRALLGSGVVALRPARGATPASLGKAAGCRPGHRGGSEWQKVSGCGASPAWPSRG